MSWRLLTAVALLLALAACADDDRTELSLGTTPPAAETIPTATLPPVPTSAASSMPTLSPTPTTGGGPTTTGVTPVGFGTVAGRVKAADGSTCDVCLWAAATLDEHTRGLMGVTDLGGADGMVFRFGSPVITQFWMRDTVMPLSIAFYAADGSFVSSADMEPCLTGPDAACARYAAAGPYQDAIEVPQGGLEELLMTAGSHLELLATPCPLTGG